MEVAPGDTSGVLTFTLFIPPFSVTLDSPADGTQSGSSRSLIPNCSERTASLIKSCLMDSMQSPEPLYVKQIVL